MSDTPSKPRHPWSRSAPEGPWDVIVVGSGMGGMTAAAMLSRLGKRVLVLEQHYVPGGFTHTFRRGGRRTGWEWDVGVHAVGEVTEHSLTGRILQDLGRGELQWTSLGPVYDAFHYPDGVDIDFPDTPQQFRANLVEAFPKEERAIDDYLRLVREVSGGMKGYYLARTAPRWLAPAAEATFGRTARRWLDRTAAEVHASLTDDPRLRAVFAAQWGYYGAPPSRASFAMQALVVKHFLHGAYYPAGGSGAIAEALLGTVAEAGGWTRVACDVRQILVERGRAVGVELADGERIEAKQVVSAAGVASTAARLLPPELVAADWARSVSSLRPGPAHLCLYLGFEGDIRPAGASAANQWFYGTWDPEDEYWDPPMDGDPGRAAVLYCSFPSLKNPRHDNPERHTGEVVTFLPWKTFERWQGTPWNKRGAGYEDFKARLQERLLEQFFENMPGLKDQLRYAELSTPLSTDHFCRPMRGSIYGLEPTPERFRNPWLRPAAPIKGLTFGGAEVTSVGVIGAMMGGVLAATSAAPRGARKYLQRVGMG